MSKLNSLKQMATATTATAHFVPPYHVVTLDPEVGEVYGYLATANGTTVDEEIRRAAVKHSVIARETKPIVLTDEQRRKIEAMLDVNLKDGQHLTERLQQLQRVKLEGTSGSKKYSCVIRIPGNVLERLESRKVASTPLAEYLTETMLTLLKQFVRLH